MEQVFASLHATYSFGIPFWEKWWEGRIEEWMCLEMVGFAQGIHFYVRTPEKYRSLVETALFSQYPDIEIHEAEEYVERFGTDLPNENYDLFGADFILSKENPYPIRTYPFFEEQVEERRIDPIATIAEVMSNLKDDEMVWLQILIRPTGDVLKKEAECIIKEITGRGKCGGTTTLILDMFAGIFHFIKNLFWGAFEHPTWPTEAREPEKPEMPKRLTPGEMDILKGIENKISKLAFESVIRFIYIDSRTKFTGANVSAINGAFRQFNTLNMNSFRPSLLTMTIPVFRFAFFRTRERVLKRKKAIFANYLAHLFPPQYQFPGSWGSAKSSILNIEELATVFHPPITAVGAPKLMRLETRKGEPPGNLPIGG